MHYELTLTPYPLTLMKKVYILLLVSLFPILSLARTSVSDTLLYVYNPDRVVITESPEGTRVSISDSGESVLIAYPDSAKISTYRRSSTLPFDLPFGYGKKGSESCGSSCNGWTVGFDGLCIGLNNALGQTGGGGLQWSKSFEINWLSCLNVGYAFSRSRIYLGLGFDWRNYKATADGRWLQPDGNGGVKWGSAPDGVLVKATQLKVFSLQLPLMYTWNIPKTHLRWRMGPILCFNTYSSIKGIYNDASGNHCEYFTRDFDRTPTTVDFFGSLSYHTFLGIYIRYSPMKVLKSASPINFTPLTLGVTFLL